jgi:CheY-like chemotaxis protein
LSFRLGHLSFGFLERPEDEVEKRVLVVDDEQGMVDLMAEILERDGYRVEAAGDGLAAMRRAESFHPHLMVLDVMMPEENGYRVSRLVKTGDGVACDPVPKVLLVTGRRLDDDPERETIFMAFSKADGIVYKPFELADLLSRVHDLIGEA